MSRRPAKVTQADLARAIRAAKQAGAYRVDVEDGTIIIRLVETQNVPVADEPEIVL